jgi:hypothetical protein
LKLRRIAFLDSQAPKLENYSKKADVVNNSTKAISCFNRRYTYYNTLPASANPKTTLFAGRHLTSPQKNIQNLLL